MDGHRDGWMKSLTDRGMNGQRDGWTDVRIDGRTDVRTYGWTYGRVEEKERKIILSHCYTIITNE